MVPKMFEPLEFDCFGVVEYVDEQQGPRLNCSVSLADLDIFSKL